MNYYNEFDPFAAAWLRELIAAGEIPEGYVDERDIREVQADDLDGYTQHHFFAGIGGWAEALRIAEWPEGKPVWTASCPCPPFSVAGKKKSCPQCEGRNLMPHVFRTGVFACCDCGCEWDADDRHLWPEFWRLVNAYRPDTIMGEQVASPDGLIWLTGVQLSLEVVGYDVWPADYPAAGVSAPHIRQRLWWVAESQSVRLQEPRQEQGRSPEPPSGHGRVADAEPQCDGAGNGRPAGWREPTNSSSTGGMADAKRQQKHQKQQRSTTVEGRWGADGPCGCGAHSRVGITNGSGSQPGCEAAEAARYRSPIESTSFWSNSTWHPCRDGKARRIPAPQHDFQFVVDGISSLMGDLWDQCTSEEQKIITEAATGFPLSGKVPGRVGLLRGAGNAIVPQVAAVFVKAWMGTKEWLL